MTATDQIILRIPPVEKQAARKIAQAKGLTLSMLVREALKQAERQGAVSA